MWPNTRVHVINVIVLFFNMDGTIWFVECFQHTNCKTLTVVERQFWESTLLVLFFCCILYLNLFILRSPINKKRLHVHIYFFYLHHIIVYLWNMFQEYLWNSFNFLFFIVCNESLTFHDVITNFRFSENCWLWFLMLCVYFIKENDWCCIMYFMNYICNVITWLLLV